MSDEHLCLICHRREDDPLHGSAEITSPIEPRIAQHAFDPGERRRRIRRMADRVHAVEDAMERMA